MRLIRQTGLRGCGGGRGLRSAVNQPKLQLQLEFNVNNCLQLHLFICTPFAQLSPALWPPFPAIPACSLSFLMMMVPPLCLCRTVGDHVDWFRFDSHFIYAWDLATSTILFHFIPFEFFSTSLATPAPPHSPLYYDYHVLFNNWCANWQLSGSFTTLHTWWSQQQQEQHWQWQ